jgi:ATP-dependent RNA helicase RhlE
MTFASLGLSQPLLRATEAEGYSTPTPIQTLAIPHILAGSDIFGCAQTGTGKTAAFALPILDLLLRAGPSATNKRKLRGLVLTPTRELASQIEASFVAYGRGTHLRHAVVFGGVNIGRQIQALARGVDVLVATPGRLLDLISQRAVALEDIEIFVLDEADRMLDIGFVRDVQRIASRLPRTRQTLMFSATTTDGIRALAQSLLRSPVHVESTPVSSTPQALDQRVYFVEKPDKRKLLAWLLRGDEVDRVLVFTRTKHSANRVAEHLSKSRISADAIHGNKSQGARQRALEGFKRGELRVLVATDIAARGIDIDRLSFVINYDLPNDSETYVHRIGRTARAGNAGQAVSFCEAGERSQLQSIERLIRKRIDVMNDHPAEFASAPPAAVQVQVQPRAARGREPRAASPQRAGGPQRGSASPQRGSASPQRGSASPQRAAASPQHGAASPQQPAADRTRRRRRGGRAAPTHGTS